MKERYIPAFIMLTAGAITSILNIVNKVQILTGLKRLLIVLIIFYILGLIVKSIMIKILENNSKKDDQNNSEGVIPEENVPGDGIASEGKE